MRTTTGGVLLAALLAACSPAGETGGEDPRAVPRCTNPAKGVEGFLLVRTREFPERGHVGVRLEYRSPDGERLYYLVGISGDVGEGLPLADEIRLADGSAARLLGRGTTWILSWRDEPPCEPVAVIANGIGRARFLALMRESGLVPPRS